MNWRLWASLSMVAMLSLGVTACSQDTPITGPADSDLAPVAATSDLDIVDTAISAGIFETLVAAVQAADLEGALRGEGPLTVFAPTDEAFAALPEGLVEKLLLPQNKEKLQELLLYHVVGRKVTTGDIRWFHFEKTLQGQYLWIRKTWTQRIKVNNALVITPDVMASNGVVQIIDTVLIPRGFTLPDDEPEPELDIVDTAIQADDFNTLVQAVQAAGLVDALRGDDLTVFAPTDAAFESLPDGLLAELLLPQNEEKLVDLLKYHVVSGRVLSRDLNFYQRVPTLEGSSIRIIKWFGNVWVNRSRVVIPDVLATNGVIHVINRVLIPRDFTLETSAGTLSAGTVETYLEARSTDEGPPSRMDPRYLTSD